MKISTKNLRYGHLVTRAFFFSFAKGGCIRRSNGTQRLLECSENSHTTLKGHPPRLDRIEIIVQGQLLAKTILRLALDSLN